MTEKYVEAADAFGFHLEVMRRVISMAAGGMDTFPHNGAGITLLAVCGLTHRQAYKDIFAITRFLFSRYCYLHVDLQCITPHVLMVKNKKMDPFTKS